MFSSRAAELFKQAIEQTRMNEIQLWRSNAVVQTCESESQEHQLRHLLEIIFEFKEMDLNELKDHEFQKHEQHVNYTAETITGTQRLTFDSRVKSRKESTNFDLVIAANNRLEAQERERVQLEEDPEYIPWYDPVEIPQHNINDLE